MVALLCQGYNVHFVSSSAAAEGPPNRPLRAGDWANRDLRRAASAATGKPWANPSREACTLRTPTVPRIQRALRRAGGSRHAASACAAANSRSRSGCRRAQQDPFAAALWRRRPYRLQDLLRLPVVTAVVEHDAVAQRRMPRRHVTAKARRHQSS